MSYYDFIVEKRKNKVVGNGGYRDLLAGTIFTMFDYKKLDTVLYKKTLESALRFGGYAITTELDDKLVTMPAYPVELPDDNGVYIKFLGYTRNGKTVERTRGVDCVVWENNSLARPETTFEWFVNILSEVDKSMEALVRHSRSQPIPLAKNSTQLEAIRTAQRSNMDGKLDVILDSETFDELIENTSVKKERVINFTDPELATKFQNLSRFHDDLIRRWATIYGHDLNGSPKSAQQSVAEIEGSESLSLTICIDNYKQRKKAVDEIVDMYGEKYELSGCEVVFSETWSKQIANFIVSDGVEVDQDIVEIEEVDSTAEDVEDTSDNGEERVLDA